VEQLIRLFNEHPAAAVFISIAVSILVAIAGILPSVFITAANILFFGFWEGTAISFIGEAVGAFIAFTIYRKGFRASISSRLQKYPAAKKLLTADNRAAFGLIFNLRLLPFVPSGVVTFAAAVGTVSPLLFFVASSLGKIPALLIEAYSVQEVTRFGIAGKLILLAVALTGLYLLIRKLLAR